MISYKPFWKLIHRRGITTYYLREKCGENNISPTSLKHMKQGKPISTATLDSLCKILQCNPGDIIEFWDEQENEEEPHDLDSKLHP